MSDEVGKNENVPLDAWQRVAVDLARCLRFYSRLPVPSLPWEADPHALPDFPRLARVLPLAGATLGVLPALALAFALALGLGPWLAAALSVAAMTLITGAFHEDGLADTADSFGGATRERRLDIMRDSRIGSFGASALMLVMILRIGALAEILMRSDMATGIVAVLITAALSRTAGLMPLVFLPPARLEGASYAVGQPPREAFWFAAGLASVLAVALGVVGGLSISGILLMLGFSGLSGLAMTRFSKRHIQGQTGDIAGATQQLAEVAALLALLTTLPLGTT